MKNEKVSAKESALILTTSLGVVALMFFGSIGTFKAPYKYVPDKSTPKTTIVQEVKNSEIPLNIRVETWEYVNTLEPYFTLKDHKEKIYKEIMERKGYKIYSMN